MREAVVLTRIALGLLLAATFVRPAAVQESIEDEARVRQSVTALSRGEGSIEGLKLELMDGGMLAHASFEIAEGKVVREAWERPGGPAQRNERPVTEAEVRALLRELLAREYWRLEGTRFVPDAPIFILRIWNTDRSYAQYGCMIEECERTPERAAIRQLLLEFVQVK
jgi:hypothetical protein